MRATGEVEARLRAGETAWCWLHDNREWDDKYTLLFSSLHREGRQVAAAFWETWDEGTGVEDPVAFPPTGKGVRRAEPKSVERFDSVTAAFEGLAPYGVTAEAATDKEQLIAEYAAARILRPPPKPTWGEGTGFYPVLPTPEA